MEEPREAVAFLTRSAIRVAILRALQSGSRDRRELAVETEASQSSLSRSLAELEDRGWVRRDGNEYVSTSAGSLVMERLVPLLQTIGGLQTLAEGVEYLPVEEMSLDVRHFDDARLVTPTEFDPTAAFHYGIDRLRDSDTMLTVARTVPAQYVWAIHEDVSAGDLETEMVVDGEYLAAVEGSELAPPWRELADETTVCRYDEFVPYRMLILDEIVHLWLCSDQGDQVGLLESDDPVVRDWAESVYEEFRAEAEPLEAATISVG